jgi:hypothetical protein
MALAQKTEGDSKNKLTTTYAMGESNNSSPPPGEIFLIAVSPEYI